MIEAVQRPAVAAPVGFRGRPCVRGKFLYAGDEKLFIRGVTYGTFRPDADGNEYDIDSVERDFEQMAAQGINTVRVYTVPPRWLLDAAERHGLRVMVGLPWEQHVAFLDDRKVARNIESRVRAGARACAGHPAVLCYAIGNEIPAPIVRWHGARRVERFLERLYRVVKSEDPGALVTYVNFPSTEYLRLDFCDLLCFNVYLESRDQLERYLARLQNLAGDRPLLMAEVGLDSRQNSEVAQAEMLDWQIRSVFAAGYVGAFIFAWTDEWFRGGYEIEDWDFGLTTRDRHPKLALDAVSHAFAEVPFPPDVAWPWISVVVCSHNGTHTIRECMEGLRRLEYPNYEVIVVDDGSTDGTAAIAAEYDVHLIRTENCGLSAARNTGLDAAKGEIVAYTDDDACPDPHWLTYLAATFLRTAYAGVGGPNIHPPDEGPVAQAVANAPGGPVHVLLTDELAEHIPGCNMAFRVEQLRAIGGFDPRFRAAGDDIDVCWRLQECGWTIGFSPAAMVWHHRRKSIRAFWKQQQGYGKAEALLETKWPEKYNAVGHITWAGRLYGKGLTEALRIRRGRIYQGIWGSALFQSVYAPPSGLLASLPLMPEWYLAIGAFVALSGLGLLWSPLLLALPLLAFMVAASVAQAAFGSARASFPSAQQARSTQIKLRTLTALLHQLQPLARLRGRLQWGLTPWRRRGWHGLAWPWPQAVTDWNEQWQAPDDRLKAVEARLRDAGAVMLRGGNFDQWDIEVRGGLLGSARSLMTIEEHGAGRQLLRFRTWPRLAVPGLLLLVVAAGLVIEAARDSAWLPALIVGGFVAVLVLRSVLDCAAAVATSQGAFARVRKDGV